MKRTFFSIVGILAATLMAYFIYVSLHEKQNIPRLETIPIGVILPLTGDYSELGKSCQRGIDLAAAACIKRDSTEDSVKVDLKYQDSQSDTKYAITAIKHLIAFNRVQVIIGEMSSTATIAISSDAESAKVILISPTASSPRISELGEYIYRVCGSDRFEAEAMAQAAFERLGLRNIAVLYLNNDYGVGLQVPFERRFSELTGKITASQAYDEKTVDFRAQLTKIRASKPDAIYLPGYATPIGLILKQSKQLKIDVQFLGTIDFENPEIVKIAGSAAEGVIFTSYQYDPQSTRPRTKWFVESYRMRYGSDPNIYAALGFDAMSVISSALAQGAVTSGEVQQALNQMKAYPGVTADITFDGNGDAHQAVVLKIFQDGRFQFFPSSPKKPI